LDTATGEAETSGPAMAVDDARLIMMKMSTAAITMTTAAATAMLI